MNRNCLQYVLLSGFLLGLIMPIPAVWPLAFIGFVPLLYAAEKAWFEHKIDPRRGFLYGLVAGIVWYAPAFVWLYNLNALVLPLAVAGLAAQVGLLTAGLIFGLRAGLRRTTLSLWVACLWTSIEILTNEFIVPMLSTGYLLWHRPLLIQTADVAGVFGVSFWIVSVNVLVARCLLDGLRAARAWGGAVICLTALVLGYGYAQYSGDLSGSTGTGANKPVTVKILQTAVNTDDKEKREVINAVLAKLVEQTISTAEGASPPADLVVWPETSVAVYVRSVTEKAIAEQLLRTAKVANTPILAGGFGFDRSAAGELKTYNSAFFVAPQGYIQQEYRKIFLVPFYERWPLYDWLPQSFRDGFEDEQISAGDAPGLMDLDSNRRFGVAICWEVYFADHVRRLVRDGALFLVNPTNDNASLGTMDFAYRTLLPHVIFRAVETRRYIVRSANGGVSMLVSPRGEVVASMTLRSEGAVTARFVPAEGKTFVVRQGFVLAKGLFWFTFAWIVLLFMRTNFRRG